jgi:hypothetical protein
MGRDIFMKKYVAANSVYPFVVSSVEIIEGLAKATEGLYRVSRDWQEEVRSSRRIVTGETRTINCMLVLKQCKNRWYYENMADLINVGRRLTQQKPVTAASLRNLIRRRPR